MAKQRQKNKHTRRSLKKQPADRDAKSQSHNPRDRRDITEKILPVIEGLKSVKLAERAVSLSAIATLIDDERMRILLKEHGLVDTLLTHTLSDNSLELAAEGFGVLRNMALEDPDTALELVRKNALVPLNAVAARVSEMYSNNLSKLSRTEVHVIYELSENLCGLSAALALTREEEVESLLSKSSALVALALVVIRECTLPQAVVSSLEFIYYLCDFMAVGEIHRNSAVSSWSADVFELGINIRQNEDASGHVGKLISLLDRIPNEEILAAQVALELLSDAATQASSSNTEMAIPVLVASLQNPDISLQAASALNNVCWNLNATQSWSQDVARELVSPTVLLLKHAPNRSDKMEAETAAEAALGVAGALAAKLGQDADLASAVMPYLTDSLEGYRRTDEHLRALVAAISVLGKTTELLEPSTEFVFRLLTHSKSPFVLVDALDALFELFGGDELEIAEFYVNQGVHRAVLAVEPRITTLLESVESNDDRIATAVENIHRFIEYKST